MLGMSVESVVGTVCFKLMLKAGGLAVRQVHLGEYNGSWQITFENAFWDAEKPIFALFF